MSNASDSDGPNVTKKFGEKKTKSKEVKRARKEEKYSFNEQCSHYYPLSIYWS